MKGGRRISFSIGILFIACYYDYTKSRIPNGLILFGFSGFICQSIYTIMKSIVDKQGIFTETCLQLASQLLFGILIVLFLSLFFFLGMLGAGDVKLFSVIALLMEPKKFLWFSLFSMGTAFIEGVLRLLIHKDGIERMTYFCSYLFYLISYRKLFHYFKDQKMLHLSGIHMAGPMLFGSICCGFIFR